MMQRAKEEGLKASEIEDSGIKSQYPGGDIYRQYYLIESTMGLKVIAEYYTAVFSVGKGPDTVNCGADLKNTYIVSSHIKGHSSRFH